MQWTGKRNDFLAKFLVHVVFTCNCWCLLLCLLYVLVDVYCMFLSFQWKVRRTLAFSIHELAQILGEEITRVELVPIFNSFLKDLDEVCTVYQPSSHLSCTCTYLTLVEYLRSSLYVPYFICLSVCPSVRPCIYPSVCLSIDLSILGGGGGGGGDIMLQWTPTVLFHMSDTLSLSTKV